MRFFTKKPPLAEILDVVPDDRRREFLYWRATSLAAVVLANLTMPPVTDSSYLNWPDTMRITVGADNVAHFARGLGRQAKVDYIAGKLTQPDSEHLRLQLNGFTSEKMRLLGERSLSDFPVLVFGMRQDVAEERGMRGSEKYEGSYYTTGPAMLRHIDPFSRKAVMDLLGAGRLAPLSHEQRPVCDGFSG